MSGKLRVFISSTMRDMKSERSAVVKAIRALNFEPVNAEGWLTSGEGIWERIAREIDSSHMFLLLLGRSYGWVPEEGPGAAEGRSVTEMEALRARELGLPIFAFTERLEYGDPLRGTPQGEARDRFRAEIAAWDDGRLVSSYETADDLARDVPAALAEVLANTWQREQVRTRAPGVTAALSADAEPPASAAAGAAAPMQPGHGSPGPELPVVLPRSLREHVRLGRTVLAAGAGMSLEAGFPSAFAMAEVLARDLRQVDAKAAEWVRHWPMQEVAAVYAATFGARRLQDAIGGMLALPQGSAPTHAHRVALRFFRHIVTTNFDELFEAAAVAENWLHQVVVEGGKPLDPASHAIQVVKLEGTLGAPNTLTVTERDAWMSLRTSLHRAVAELVKDRPLLVVGSSIRDVKLKDILYSRAATAPGWVVVPRIDALEERRFRDLGLEPIQASADAFFRALDEALPAPPPAR